MSELQRGQAVKEAAARALYGAAGVRELDRRAIAAGTPGYELMQRAAAACWRELRARRPDPARLHAVCGPGNNGGDGYEIACLAHDAGWPVQVWSVGRPREDGDGARARRAWLSRGAVAPYAAGVLDDAQVIVDAIYGTGIARPVEGPAAQAIAEINARAGQAFVLAVDVPSGLDADTGRVQGIAVHAQLTVSFIGRKLGLYTGSGPDHAGERVFDALGVEADAAVAPLARLLDASDLAPALPRRARDAHKGRHGYVLLIGGDSGYAGAILLAARAALRSGAGLVGVATRGAHAALLASAQPEAMFTPADTPESLQTLMQRADVIAIGPGLGRGDWGRAAWAAASASAQPLVIDADALNLLAEAPRPAAAPWVLTPHPGEAARLLGCGVAEIECDRRAACAALAQRYGCVAVLKGAGSLVAADDAEDIAVCPYGNPGMASGGSGDVLTGVIAALMAQGLAAGQAAATGVLAHALAGDRAAAAGERGLLPSDVIAELRAVLNP